MTPGERGPAAWAEYLRAAQRLDAVRREAAAAVTARAAAVQQARQELDRLRQRLALQRNRLTAASVGLGRAGITAGAGATAADVCQFDTSHE